MDLRGALDVGLKNVRVLVDLIRVLWMIANPGGEGKLPDHILALWLLPLNRLVVPPDCTLRRLFLKFEVLLSWQGLYPSVFKGVLFILDRFWLVD